MRWVVGAGLGVISLTGVGLRAFICSCYFKSLIILNLGRLGVDQVGGVEQTSEKYQMIVGPILGFPTSHTLLVIEESRIQFAG